MNLFTRVDFGEREISNELSLIHTVEYQDFIHYESTAYVKSEPTDNYNLLS